MPVIIWSCALSALNCLSLWLMSRSLRGQGWWLVLSLQVPWTWYDIATRQWGFLLIAAVNAVVALRELSRQ